MTAFRSLFLSLKNAYFLSCLGLFQNFFHLFFADNLKVCLEAKCLMKLVCDAGSGVDWNITGAIEMSEFVGA